ncbi:MAG: sulfur carrier protein ThiS [Firmicutes bacterium]|nr:sulfur carrier protein ThiS [Bacillota bacterium]
MIYLNGKEHEDYGSLAELLKDNGYKRDKIAVEINGAIIKKSDYDKTAVNSGDVIEVVSFVGGG